MSAAYLAGPMRSRPNFNYPAFLRYAALLRGDGWTVHNPAEMDIENDQGGPSMWMSKEEQEKHGADPSNARRYAKRDLSVILSLKAEHGDAIILLDGWEESTGARAERAVAEWLGLKIMTIEEALNE